MTDIRNTIGVYSPETGGILGRGKDGVISHFLFDYNDESTSYKYVPSANYLNEYMENNWFSNSIAFCGMVHSHPNKAPSLSKGDLAYAKKIIESFDNLDHLYLLIVFDSEGNINIHYYKAFLNEHNMMEVYKYSENEIQILA